MTTQTTCSSTVREDTGAARFADSVRNWDLDECGALAVLSFPYTSRRTPRVSRSQRTDAR